MSKRRDALRAAMTSNNSSGEARPIVVQELPPAPIPAKIPGALNAMSNSLQHLVDDAKIAKEMRQQIENGGAVVELDSSLVEPSQMRDRLSDISIDEELRASIDEHGQQVPILVRKHPTQPDHWQVAYGHRRLRVLQKLGRPVKAIVRNMSDDEMIIAQGNENGDRRDLSFIERALFATRLEQHGTGRQVIMAALSVNKVDLSNLISIAGRLSEDLIQAIGAAPKIGRPRWEQLSRLTERSGSQWRNITASNAFVQMNSNARFEYMLKRLSDKDQPTGPQMVRRSDGTSLAKVDRSKAQTKIIIDNKTDQNFGDWLTSRLADLHAAFQQEEAALRQSKSISGE